MTSKRAVELTASPIDPYVDLVTNAFGNLGTILEPWLDDPLPVLVQFIVNWAGYQQTTISSFVAAGESLVAALGNLPGQLQTLFADLAAGNLDAALGQLVAILQGFTVDPAEALAPLLTIPEDIAQNLVSALEAAAGTLRAPVGLAAAGAVNATIAEVELTAQNFVNELGSGNLRARWPKSSKLPRRSSTPPSTATSPVTQGCSLLSKA